MNMKNILWDQQGEFQHIIHKDNYIEREFGNNFDNHLKSNLIKTIVGVGISKNYSNIIVLTIFYPIFSYHSS